MRLDNIFNQCRKVPQSVKIILIGKGTRSSDYTCIYPRKENINDMIQLFNVTSAYRETTRITFALLSTTVIEKACDEWNCVINSDRFYKEEL